MIRYLASLAVLWALPFAVVTAQVAYYGNVPVKVSATVVVGNGQGKALLHVRGQSVWSDTGAQIEGQPNLVLDRVYRDHVLILQGGNSIRVDLEGSPSSAALSKQGFAQSDASSFKELMRVSWYAQSGRAKGLKVGPGKARQQFSRSPLKAGDVITGINGVVLSNKQIAMSNYNTISRNDQATFAINRKGELLTVEVDIRLF